MGFPYTAEFLGAAKDGIFDDVLALKQPSAMWPRPSPVGAPSARGNILRQRRLKWALPWPRYLQSTTHPCMQHVREPQPCQNLTALTLASR